MLEPQTVESGTDSEIQKSTINLLRSFDLSIFSYCGLFGCYTQYISTCISRVNKMGEFRRRQERAVG